MKRLLIGLVCILVAFSAFVFIWASLNPDIVTAFPSVSDPQPIDLNGSWTQKKAIGADAYMVASIDSNVIRVYWVTDGGDSKSLYWWGSFDEPENLDAEYSWESINDHSKTDSSMLASSADTKEFLYQNGELTFSASLMGTTKTIRMAKDK